MKHIVSILLLVLVMYGRGDSIFYNQDGEWVNIKDYNIGDQNV